MSEISPLETAIKAWMSAAEGYSADRLSFNAYARCVGSTHALCADATQSPTGKGITSFLNGFAEAALVDLRILDVHLAKQQDAINRYVDGIVFHNWHRFEKFFRGVESAQADIGRIAIELSLVTQAEMEDISRHISDRIKKQKTSYQLRPSIDRWFQKMEEYCNNQISLAAMADITSTTSGKILKRIGASYSTRNLQSLVRKARAQAKKINHARFSTYTHANDNIDPDKEIDLRLILYENSGDFIKEFERAANTVVAYAAANKLRTAAEAQAAIKSIKGQLDTRFDQLRQG